MLTHLSVNLVSAVSILGTGRLAIRVRAMILIGLMVMTSRVLSVVCRSGVFSLGTLGVLVLIVVLVGVRLAVDLLATVCSPSDCTAASADSAWAVAESAADADSFSSGIGLVYCEAI